MLFERRFYTGLIAGGLLGVVVGVMLLPRREREEGGRLASEARRVSQRVTGWLKK
ncbi:MAG: hypothetical protein H5U01_00625 [Clostridia bacterium]|nr:hypothetical protein [Clostridia bacterium]